ncbi:hypothetical protein M2137_000326 [Parabacteroides sp. PFB2-10]|nr:hypothetical protein [Parabacteroides sp. PFB2-10]
MKGETYCSMAFISLSIKSIYKRRLAEAILSTFDIYILSDFVTVN